MPEGKTVEDLFDPNDEDTFQRSKLDWPRADSPDGRRHLAFLCKLIQLRQAYIVPLLKEPGVAEPHILPTGPGLLAIDWRFKAATLAIRANLTTKERTWPDVSGETIFALSGDGTAGPSIAVAIGPP